MLFSHQDQGDKVTIATPNRAGAPFCQFEDVPMEGGRRATVLRENPAGRKLPIGDPQQVCTSHWATPREMNSILGSEVQSGQYKLITC